MTAHGGANPAWKSARLTTGYDAVAYDVSSPNKHIIFSILPSKREKKGLPPAPYAHYEGDHQRLSNLDQQKKQTPQQGERSLGSLTGAAHLNNATNSTHNAKVPRELPGFENRYSAGNPLQIPMAIQSAEVGASAGAEAARGLLRPGAPVSLKQPQLTMPRELPVCLASSDTFCKNLCMFPYPELDVCRKQQ